MKDQLVECKRCNGNACYEQHIDEKTTTWLCMGCGFTTSTMMLEDSKIVVDLMETSPELYKDLLFKDSNNRIWAPSTITLPNKGMVFLDGNNKDNWRWAAVNAIEITDEDRKLKQYPENQTHRMDMPNVKYFGQREFMDALEVIGFYEA